MHHENCQAIKHFREYLPGISLPELKGDVLSLDVGSFRFKIETFPSSFWVYIAVIISKDSTHIIKSQKVGTFPEACKLIREFLDNEQKAIAQALKK